MNLFTIRDLEVLTGIKAHTIRIWESRYNFIKPGRTQTNIRHYNDDELKRLLNISLLNKYGYKISHIDRMTDVEINQKIVHLSDVHAIQDKLIHQLIRYMLDIDMESFESALDDSISDRGIEVTMLQIIMPFLERVGFLWMGGHVYPAQEHLVSNIIRQKILVCTNNVKPVSEKNKTALLFLPEGEYNELSLLFIQYIFKSRGIKVIYLGVNVSVEDIEYMLRVKSPDFIYTHISGSTHRISFERFLAHASVKFDKIPVIISGSLAQHYERKYPARVVFKRTLPDVISYLPQIISGQII